MRDSRESWQPTLDMMGFDVGKELPEDALLGDSGDIPAFMPTGERYFDFIQKEVHTQLAHLSARERDIILGVLALLNQQYLKRGRCLGWRHVADMRWIFLNDRVHDR